MAGESLRNTRDKSALSVAGQCLIIIRDEPRFQEIARKMNLPAGA
jgi:hypothetical protein